MRYYLVCSPRSGSMWMRNMLRPLLSTVGKCEAPPLADTYDTNMLTCPSDAPTPLIKDNSFLRSHMTYRRLGGKVFFMTRCLKDSIVSWAFYTDKFERQKHGLQASKIRISNIVDDILYGNNGFVGFKAFYDRQQEWIDSGVEVITFEEMKEDAFSCLQRALKAYDIPYNDDYINDTVVKAMVERSSFKRLSRGREPGSENPLSYFRKGVVGDYSNHLDEVQEAFINSIMEK